MDVSKLEVPAWLITAFGFFCIACAGIVVRWVMKKLNLLEELTAAKLTKLENLPNKDWFDKIGKLEDDLPNKEWFKRREEVEDEILRKLPEPRRIAKHYALMHKANGLLQIHALEIDNLKNQMKQVNTKVFGS